MKTTYTEIDIAKRKLILRDFQNGLNYTQAKNNIIAEFGNCVGYGERTCSRWFNKFGSGNFDVYDIPRDKRNSKKASESYRKKLRKTKTIKEGEVKFKQQNLGTPMDVAKTEIVEDINKNKPELTVSKTATKSIKASKKAQEPNKLPTNITAPKNQNRNSANERDEATSENLPKLRPRRPRSKGVEIQLPVSAAKEMKALTHTESHNIGLGNKKLSRKGADSNAMADISDSKKVTVQFQNLNPQITKNTVRKNTAPTRKQLQTARNPKDTLRFTNGTHLERNKPEKPKSIDQTSAELPTKRSSLPQSSGLTNPTGIIYLNPQEIFRQSFAGFENSLNRPKPVHSSPKVFGKPFPHPLFLTQQPTAKQESIVLCDSEDSNDDDVLFPENISLPIPKAKTDITFTSYWDLENCTPIDFNANEPVVPKAPVLQTDVIEID